MSGRTSASQRGGGELGSSNYNPRGNDGGEQKWYKSNSSERRSSFENRSSFAPSGDRPARSGSGGGRGGNGRANDNGNFKSRSSFGGGRSSGGRGR